MKKVMCLKCKKELFEYKENLHPKTFRYLIKRLMDENKIGVWRLTNDEGKELSRMYLHPECMEEEYKKMGLHENQKEFYNKMLKRLENGDN